MDNKAEIIKSQEKPRIADENDFQDHFPGCEVGAMPPFGNLYGIRVILAQTLCGSTTISFNSGVHTEIIQMDYDYNHQCSPLNQQCFKKVLVDASFQLD
ncbi:MAG: hypothetical protein KZQ70_13660 [gamma proteobacterium symbiont of Lucinoma myriamae]|nr:hypothetical protein [gamma proteobacterium symbiont of Lucinoma myriamae]MCU7819564.1 hypothetical protein [gamma proteobacterium symbiont of Lucinoma myriamae]MCU7833300.1 hypothetical protein [gamma proteobacterium symbiont of Lucinoma myriamae]